ncbi:MAG: prepilin peptidase [Bacillota bacterium]|jgi:leader peptidase (prepilin peptidase)/N-methyltransferase
MNFLIIFVLGLIIGSFNNLCIDRIPRGESIIFPPSRCENCGERLKPIDLIPVLSYFFLQRKCRHCHASLSWRDPVIEILTGLLFVIIYYCFPSVERFLPYVTFGSILVIISFIDLDCFRIPDSLIITGLIIGTGFNIFFYFIYWSQAIIGFLVGGGTLLLIALASGGGMGGGDIKLGAMIGFYLGWQGFLLTLFLGALFASIVGIFCIISKKKSKKDAIPFGPFLSMGAIINLILGGKLINYYILTFFF